MVGWVSLKWKRGNLDAWNSDRGGHMERATIVAQESRGASHYCCGLHKTQFSCKVQVPWLNQITQNGIAMRDVCCTSEDYDSKTE
jgi:hypothetical protein